MVDDQNQMEHKNNTQIYEDPFVVNFNATFSVGLYDSSHIDDMDHLPYRM